MYICWTQVNYNTCCTKYNLILVMCSADSRFLHTFCSGQLKSEWCVKDETSHVTWRTQQPPSQAYVPHNFLWREPELITAGCKWVIVMETVRSASASQSWIREKDELWHTEYLEFASLGRSFRTSKNQLTDLLLVLKYEWLVSCLDSHT